MREMVNSAITFVPLRYHKKKDGTVFPVEVTPANFQWNGRKVIFGAIRDISERVKAEKDLRFTYFGLDHSNDAAFWMDAQGHFVYVNQAACSNLGYTREELLSMRLADIDPDFPTEAWPQVWEEVRRRKVWTLTARHRTKEGHTFPVEVTANYVNFDGQEYDCTMVRDISERVLAEQKLQSAAQNSERLREELELLLDSVPEGIYGMDPQGMITFANPAAAKLLGWNQADLIGKSAHDIMHHSHPDGSPYDPKTCPITMTLSQRTNQSEHNEVYWRKDGAHFEVEYVCAEIREGGKILGAVVIFRDISDRRRLEAVARQSEKMSGIGQLAAGVAHELNNPLGVILGFAQALTRRISASDPNADPLRSIEREAIRCRNLVQNLLLFSREHKPGFSLENPVTMLQSALSLVEAQAKVKRVEVRKEIAPDVPVVEMDGNQIQQVIINLCSNAMDAMPDGGVLTVGLGREEDRIVLRIADNGSGIPKEIREKIWEPFFTTKAAGKGTGLGLSLVYEIVHKHHGQIDLQSEVGKGTAFSIRLPFSQSK
jgi:PAS domain S-box-containing protein